MATWGIVRQGSRGDAVTTLQNYLNQHGYGLNVDGVFGGKTAAAVRDYQSKNGLSVDGIVGNNTWGSLEASNAGGSSGDSASGGSAGSKSTADFLADYEQNKPAEYAPSQAVTDAAGRLTETESKKPGEYQSKYEQQIAEALDKILNRDSFSYDFNADPMYQQYAQRYQQQGQMAMMDTMGQAAALTGGYGNSYAQTVGQQTYQNYLQRANDVIPELYDAAYGRYRDEGNDMRNNLSTLQGLDESDYGRYRDTVGDWQNDRNYYAGRYDSIRGDDYGRYRDSVGDWQNDRNYWYGKSQDELTQSNWQKEYDLAAAQASGGSGSSGSGGSSGGGGSSGSSGSGGAGGHDVSAIQRALNAAGYDLSVDGKWGPKTEAAVRKFQSTNGLTSDGIVGSKTWGALTGGSGSGGTTITNKSGAKKTDNDFNDYTAGEVDWVYVGGYGRLSNVEFQNYLKSGKIKAKKNSDGSTTYVKA